MINSNMIEIQNHMVNIKLIRQIFFAEKELIIEIKFRRDETLELTFDNAEDFYKAWRTLREFYNLVPVE